MLRPHDHTAWFGDGQAELYAMASEALIEGVRRNEKLVFVATEPNASLLQGLDTERLIDDGQLVIVDVPADVVVGLRTHVGIGAVNGSYVVVRGPVASSHRGVTRLDLNLQVGIGSIEIRRDVR